MLLPVVEHKDVVLAILGASAGLSGLVLVFLGLVATATSSFAAGTKPAILKRARRPVFAVLGTFGVGIACVACAVSWLLLDGSGDVYTATVLLFLAQLAALVVATVWVVRRALWGYLIGTRG
jgi:hypothetical protein